MESVKVFIRKYFTTLLYVVLLTTSLILLKIELPKYKSVLLLLTIVSIVDIFIWLRAKKTLVDCGNKLIRIPILIFYFIPNVMLLIGALCLPFLDISQLHPFIRVYWLGIIVILMLPRISVAIVWLINVLYCAIFQGQKTARYLKKNRFAINIIAYTLSLLFFLYGAIFTVFDMQIEKLNLRENSVKQIPQGLKGYKILQITDVHIGSYLNSNFLEELVIKSNALKPDVIVLTGDLLNFSTFELEPHIDVLSKLYAPDGIYTVMGNHDYGDYIVWDNEADRLKSIDQLHIYYKLMNWIPLDNNSLIIPYHADTIRLVGTENWGKGRFSKKGDIKKALDETEGIVKEDSNVFTVLLTHDPSHFDSVVHINYPEIDLTLCGHTHAMQMGVRLFGKLYSPCVFLYEKFSGLYIMDNGQMLYVDSGVGFNGLPFRLGIKPQITLIEF